MCNDYRLEVDIASIMEDFDDLKIKIDLPEGTPNVAAREDIKITDMAPIVAQSTARRRRARQPALELAGPRRQAGL